MGVRMTTDHTDNLNHFRAISSVCFDLLLVFIINFFKAIRKASDKVVLLDWNCALIRRAFVFCGIDDSNSIEPMNLEFRVSDLPFQFSFDYLI